MIVYIGISFIYQCMYTYVYTYFLSHKFKEIR